MSKKRVTTEVLASGQPRPYADSRYHVRVTFEWNGWRDPNAEFEPQYLSEKIVRERLLKMQVGFVENTRDESQWYDTRLDWLKPIDPRDNGGVTVASVWEFHTTTPYTD